MKKIIILSSLALIGLSCSSNDNDDTTEVVETPVLLTKMIVDGNAVSIKYDGNKIVEVATPVDNGKTVFTYTGNLITKVTDYDDKGLVTGTADYTYDKDKLIHVRDASTTMGSNTPNIYTLTFSYPNSTTINCTEIRNYTFAGNPQVAKSEITYTVNNGEVISAKEIYYHNNTLEGNIVATYTYDDKNNPYKNILGFDKLGLYNPLEPNGNLSMKRNLTTATGTNTPVNSSASGNRSVFTNSYSDKGYPTQIKETQYGPNNEPRSSRTTSFVYNQ